jgi:hypothetical protein
MEPLLRELAMRPSTSEMADQRLRVRVHGLGANRNRLGFHTPGAFCKDHRASRGKIGRKRFTRVFHQKMESHPPSSASRFAVSDCRRQRQTAW